MRAAHTTITLSDDDIAVLCELLTGTRAYRSKLPRRLDRSQQRTELLPAARHPALQAGLSSIGNRSAAAQGAGTRRIRPVAGASTGEEDEPLPGLRGLGGMRVLRAPDSRLRAREGPQAPSRSRLMAALPKPRMGKIGECLGGREKLRRPPSKGPRLASTRAREEILRHRGVPSGTVATHARGPRPFSILPARVGLEAARE